MSDKRLLSSFELRTRFSPEEVIKRLTAASDDLDAKTDREAWLSFFRRSGRFFCGNKPFRHKRFSKSIFLQKRSGAEGDGVDLQIEPLPEGSKLVGRPALVPTDRTWGWAILLILAYTSYAIICDVVAGKAGRGMLLWIPLFFGICLGGYVFLNPSVRRRPTEQTALVERWLKSLLNAKPYF